MKNNSSNSFWAEADSILSTWPSLKDLTDCVETLLSASVSSQWIELAKSSKTLAELHSTNSKDPEKKRSIGYTYFSIFALLRLQRFGQAAAQLDWLKKFKEAKKACDNLEEIIARHFSKEKTPNEPAPASAPAPAANPELLEIKPQTPLFSNLSVSDIRELLKQVKTKKIEPKTVLFSEGDEPDAFYLVAEGEMELSSKSGLKKTFKEGDFFGEIGLLSKKKRTGTITAIKKSEVLIFSKELLVKSFIKFPDLENRLVHALYHRVFQQLALKNPFFSKFDEDSLNQFFFLLEPMYSKAGSVLSSPKEAQSCFFFIIDGQVTLECLTGKKEVLTYSPGEFVNPQLGRSIAKTACDLLTCPTYAFDHLCKEYPKLGEWLKSKKA